MHRGTLCRDLTLVSQAFITRVISLLAEIWGSDRACELPPRPATKERFPRGSRGCRSCLDDRVPVRCWVPVSPMPRIRDADALQWTSMRQALQSSTQVPSSRSRSAFTLRSSSRTCIAAMAAQPPSRARRWVVKGSRTTVAVTRPTGTRESDRRGRPFAQTALAEPAESVTSCRRQAWPGPAPGAAAVPCNASCRH